MSKKQKQEEKQGQVQKQIDKCVFVLDVPKLEEKSKTIADVMYNVEGDNFKDSLYTMIKARTPIIAIQTIEEKRFMTYLQYFRICKSLQLFTWDIVDGVIDYQKQDTIDIDNKWTRDTGTEQERILSYITAQSSNLRKEHLKEYKDKGLRGDLYVLLDFQGYLDVPRIVRRLKTLSNINSLSTTIIVGPQIKNELDLEMRKIIPTLCPPDPQDEDFKLAIYEMADIIENSVPGIIDHTKANEDQLLKVLQGKTIYEAQSWMANNVVKYMNLLGKKEEE